MFSKLIEKYNNLAREALSSEDKILSENYFQHADHFTRVLNEQESYKKAKFSLENSGENKNNEDISCDEKLANDDTKEKITEKKEELEAKVAAVK